MFFSVLYCSPTKKNIYICDCFTEKFNIGKRKNKNTKTKQKTMIEIMVKIVDDDNDDIILGSIFGS